MTRRATCSCGQLQLTIEGEPSRISMCHCLECQRRTGAVISNQARFRREQVTFGGKATAWMRTAESGKALTFHFCPTCGSTVYWEGEGFPGYVAVAIGNFADPNFPAPTIGVWEESRHSWVSLPPDTPPKRRRSRDENHRRFSARYSSDFRCVVNVRFGSKADIVGYQRDCHLRFVPIADIPHRAWHIQKACGRALAR